MIKKLYQILKKYRPIGIFNLAAETHVDRSIDDSKNFIKSNIIGVYNILEVLRKIKRKRINIKLLHVSTDEVYGDLKSSQMHLKVLIIIQVHYRHLKQVRPINKSVYTNLWYKIDYCKLL